jgi:1,4-dihydroxy-2-naphthoate polyprenyltransferase
MSQADQLHLWGIGLVFIALHLFIYPASNVYNSYMDRDTGSIGGLETPPPVTRKLYHASIIFDVSGLIICLLCSWKVMMLVLLYVLFSKAYSWHGIRIKKYAFASWGVIAFFQGGYTFMLANMIAENNISFSWVTIPHLMCMGVATILIGGSYPLTQIYQHNEDSERGDFTISYRLGIRGTFIFTFLCFVAGAVLLFLYFLQYGSLTSFLIFLGSLSPVMMYFLYWFYMATRNNSYADFKHTMFMNKISAMCMGICFIILIVMRHAVISR